MIGERTIELTAADAMEFLSKVSYTGNWLSETHEQFCGLSWSDWVALVTSLGFTVDARSGAWRNDWLVEHRFAAVTDLLDPDDQPPRLARHPPPPGRPPTFRLTPPLGDMRMSP